MDQYDAMRLEVAVGHGRFDPYIHGHIFRGESWQNFAPPVVTDQTSVVEDINIEPLTNEAALKRQEEFKNETSNITGAFLIIGALLFTTLAAMAMCVA